jgi:hypothetical protein
VNWAYDDLGRIMERKMRGEEYDKVGRLQGHAFFEKPFWIAIAMVDSGREGSRSSIF